MQHGEQADLAGLRVIRCESMHPRVPEYCEYGMHLNKAVRICSTFWSRIKAIYVPRPARSKLLFHASIFNLSAGLKDSPAMDLTIIQTSRYFDIRPFFNWGRHINLQFENLQSANAC